MESQASNIGKEVPLVAVVVPCFNQAAYLPEALDSVLAQTFTGWECIVVNDCSSDGSLQIAESYARADDRFQVIDLAENKGVANARNVGIRATAASYILPLDGDDKLHPDLLRLSIDIIRATDTLKLVYSDVVDFGTINQETIRPNFNLREFCYNNQIHCTALFRKSDFELTEGYRENMVWGYEDWDLWMQMINSEQEVYKIPEPLFYARHKPMSRNNSLQLHSLREWQMRFQLFENNSTFFQIHAPEVYLAKTTVSPSRLFKLGARIRRFTKELLK